MLLQHLFWTRLFNAIIQNYLNASTICLLWNDEIDFALESTQSVNISSLSAFISIKPDDLKESFEKETSEEFPNSPQDDSYLEDLVEHLVDSIEISHCEVFFAFQKDIGKFIEAFGRASRKAVWRSARNKFIFAFHDEGETKGNSSISDFFRMDFFDEQSRILVIENFKSNQWIFNLKTNYFVGPKDPHRRDLYLLDTFDAKRNQFMSNSNLFPDKFRDLKGREVVLGALHYRPTVALEYGPQYQTQDLAVEDEEQRRVRIDGTDARYLIAFCELYNCTLQINTAEADDWGFIYPNGSSFGALGMVYKGTADVAVGAMYAWYEIYQALDMSMYLSRHGVTCVVPAPRRQTSWLLPLEPFQVTLWIAVIFCLLIEILSLLAVRILEGNISGNVESWWRIFTFAYSTPLKIFVSQSGDDKVSTMTVRVVVFACLLIDIIVTSIYGGGLASILTIPSYEEAADSLERLHSHKMKWAGNSMAWISGLLESDDPIIKDLLKKFKIYSEGELLNLVLQRDTAIALERLPFGHYALDVDFTEQALRRMKIMIDDIYFQYTVTFTARLWPLIEEYNNLIYMWHSSGLDKYWEWRVVADFMNSQVQKVVEASRFESNDDLGPVPLDITNFAGMLIIWIIGIIMAIFSFCTELFYEKFLRP